MADIPCCMVAMIIIDYFRGASNLIIKAKLSASFPYENQFRLDMNQTNFHNKNFAFNLSFIVRFKATRK